VYFLYILYFVHSLLLLLLLLLTKRLTWHIVRKLLGHVTNKKKKTATCSVDGSTVEVSAISTTSQTSIVLRCHFAETKFICSDQRQRVCISADISPDHCCLETVGQILTRLTIDAL